MSRISRSRWTATENPARVDADRLVQSGLEPTERYDGLHPACHLPALRDRVGLEEGALQPADAERVRLDHRGARPGRRDCSETVERGRCGGVDDEVVAKLIQLAGEVDGVETEAGRVRSDDRRVDAHPAMHAHCGHL